LRSRLPFTTCAYIHIYTHTHMHTSPHTSIHPHSHPYTHTHTPHTYIRPHIRTAYIHTSPLIYVHTSPHIYIPTYICTALNTYIHTKVHTYIHTYKHPPPPQDKKPQVRAFFFRARRFRFFRAFFLSAPALFFSFALVSAKARVPSSDS
jgi:hypothetical protein